MHVLGGGRAAHRPDALACADHSFISDRGRRDPAVGAARPGHALWMHETGLDGEINHHYGGRGVDFDDPDGHLMEIITRPFPDTPGG